MEDESQFRKPTTKEPPRRSGRGLVKAVTEEDLGGRVGDNEGRWHTLAAKGMARQEFVDKKLKANLDNFAATMGRYMAEEEANYSNKDEADVQERDCFAVAVDPANKNKLVVAFNGAARKEMLKRYLKENVRSLKNEDDNELDKEVKKRFNILPSPDSNTKYHAEMKILDYYSSLGKGPGKDPDGTGGFPAERERYIGISRPCCLKCAAALSVSKVGYQGCHGRSYQWRMPDHVRNNPDRLKKFLGDEMEMGPDSKGRFVEIASNYQQQSRSEKKWDFDTGAPNDEKLEAAIGEGSKDIKREKALEREAEVHRLEDKRHDRGSKLEAEAPLPAEKKPEKRKAPQAARGKKQKLENGLE